MASPASPHRETSSTDAPNRLWFHLYEVVPLALHAVGSPRRALTAAQLMAFAPLAPALTWESGDGGSALASNGLPVWRDSDGRPRVARAHTWQPPAAGARPDRYGYLPLISPDGDGRLVSHLIDVSRDKHWLSIDIAVDGLVIRTDQVDFAEQHGDGYPHDATWTEATVACVPRTGAGRYPALIADGHHNINGGALARFDASTVTRMILDLGHSAHSAEPGARTLLRWAGDRVEVSDEQIDVIDGTPRPRRYDVIGPDPDGLYPIGGHLWTWQPLDTGRR